MEKANSVEEEEEDILLKKMKACFLTEDIDERGRLSLLPMKMNDRQRTTAMKTSCLHPVATMTIQATVLQWREGGDVATCENHVSILTMI